MHKLLKGIQSPIFDGVAKPQEITDAVQGVPRYDYHNGQFADSYGPEIAFGVRNARIGPSL